MRSIYCNNLFSITYAYDSCSVAEMLTSFALPDGIVKFQYTVRKNSAKLEKFEQYFSAYKTKLCGNFSAKLVQTSKTAEKFC